MAILSGYILKNVKSKQGLGLEGSLTFAQGKQVKFAFVVKNNGVAVNITNWTFFFKVKDLTGAVQIDASTANGKITLDAPNGLVTMTISGAELAALPVFSGEYELEVVAPSSQPQRYFFGDFQLLKEICT